jgi:hypothetical protein
MKTCGRCGVSKPLKAFHRHRLKLDGRDTRCRDCRVELARLAQPRRRERKLLNHYALSLADYDRMLKAQRGRCGICRQKPVKHLAVDHDHDTGAVRGLLCCGCNMGLGHFRDRPAALLKAIQYLLQGGTHANSGRCRALVPASRVGRVR